NQPGSGYRGFFSYRTDAPTGSVLSGDEIILQQAAFRSPVNLPPDDGNDVIDAYFVPPFAVGPGPGNPIGLAHNAVYISDNHLARDLQNQVFVGFDTVSNNIPITLAHELMHVLTNLYDSESSDEIFFPRLRSFPDGAGTTVNVSRRMLPSTAGRARDTRGPNL